MFKRSLQIKELELRTRVYKLRCSEDMEKGVILRNAILVIFLASVAVSMVIQPGK